RQIAVAFPFTLTSQLARRLAKRLQENVVHLAIRQLRGSCAQGQPGEFLRQIGRRTNRIEQLLGRQQARDGVREVFVIVLVEVVGLGTQLIRPRVQDHAQQVLDV